MPAGFTRVEYLGKRRNDKARVAKIELVNNPIEQYEKNEFRQQVQAQNLQSFWAWEHKILKQEQQQLENQLKDLELKIEREIDEAHSNFDAAEEGKFDL